MRRTEPLLQTPSAIHQRKLRALHPERYKNYGQKYRHSAPDRYREYNARWYNNPENKDKLLAKWRRKGLRRKLKDLNRPPGLPVDVRLTARIKWEYANPGQSYEAHQKAKLKVLSRRRYLTKKEHIQAVNRAWRLKHPEKQRAINRRSRAKSARLRNNRYWRGLLDRRMRYALHGIGKASSVTTLLGCSVEFFRQHLESQFTSQMTWENYGKDKLWEIDHKLPCASFDLTRQDQQRLCFHYSNLRPLTIRENRTRYYKERAKS